MIKSFEFIEEAEAIKTFTSITDHSLTPVSELWRFDSNKLYFEHNVVKDVSDAVIDQVFSLTHHDGCSSEVFKRHWAKHKKEYSEKKVKPSSLSDVVQELWINLVYAEFVEDLKSLSDGLKLSLDKVSVLFEGLSDIKVLEKELNKWCEAVKFDGEKSWVRVAAQKIIDYQKLARYSFTAKTLMEVKEALQLTGDFSVLQAFLDQV